MENTKRCAGRSDWHMPEKLTNLIPGTHQSTGNGIFFPIALTSSRAPHRQRCRSAMGKLALGRWRFAYFGMFAES